MLKRRDALALPWLASLPRPAQAGMNFPRDFGAHPAQSLEWWYLTGLLGEVGGAPQFGFQLTFFRLRGPAPAEHPSRLAARELLIGHAALSDLQAGRHHHDQRLSRGLPGAVVALESDCAVQMRDWQLHRTGDDRYRATLRAREGWALSLDLQPDGPPLLQGEAGHSRKGPRPEQFSRYYSRPQLAATGELQLDGRRQPVQGQAWLDHEWSDDLLGAAAGTDAAVGWDWLGINLRDGSALTLFQLRRADGSQLWAGGSFRPRGQAPRNFGPDEIEMTPLRRWHGYPVEWRLRCPAGTWTLKAWFDAQEVDARRSTGMVYWEGAARLLDGAGQEAGLGYLELTGYAERMHLG
jgi:predicted secreted hydrolase